MAEAGITKAHPNAGTTAHPEDALHPNCVVCSPANPRGLGLRFEVAQDGRGVEATFDCNRVFEGYEGLMHGGIVCSLLDGAMTNCLFRLGRVAYTGQISVRFQSPVLADRTATVRGWVEQSRGRLHLLAAELLQEGRVKAVASAKFVEGLPEEHAGAVPLGLPLPQVPVDVPTEIS